MWCIFLEICLSKLKVQQLEKEEKQDEISTEKEKDFKAPWSHDGTTDGHLRFVTH